MSIPHIPILRFGRPYESLDRVALADHRAPGGAPLAEVSQANAGLVRRDLARLAAARAALERVTTADLLRVCAKAGELFMAASLPVGTDDATQSPQQYVEALSATSGLPYALVRRNMAKLHEVLTQMPGILRGLTRGLDLAVLERGLGEHDGMLLSFYPTTDALGVVLPSNSPGVNSIWLPAVALRVPVVLKPGREEPWTPYRLVQALLAAGCPAEALGFYPTDHEGSQAILGACGRVLLFGDEKTVSAYAGNPAVQVHGPGRSKVLIGADEIARWPQYLDVLVASIAENGGRSCINASAIVVPAQADELADALAQRLAAIEPAPRDDPAASLAAFANPQVADAIDQTIEEGLATPGARDVTAAHRRGGPSRRVVLDGATYLRPTLVRCESFAHLLANREFLFPYASVVEVPQDQVLHQIGPSLVVTAITRDPAFRAALLRSPLIERLNLGPLPTSRVRWDQPHEGNLFEFLYRRRAIQLAPAE